MNSFESLYQPSEEEVQAASEMMTEREQESSEEREGRSNLLENYGREARKVEMYLNAAPEEKAEASIFIDEKTLKTVFGEGLPLKNVYHDFGGLTGMVAPHSFWTAQGRTLVDELSKSGADARQVAAAQALVNAYERYSQAIVEKSPTLQSWIAPLEGSADEPLGEEEVRILEGLGFRLKDSEKTRKQYINLMEPNFGRYFRRYAMHALTPQEFAEYSQEIGQALQGLVEAA